MALKCTEAWGMQVCVIQCNMIIVSNLILDENCTATVLNCVFISDAYIYMHFISNKMSTILVYELSLIGTFYSLVMDMSN